MLSFRTMASVKRGRKPKPAKVSKNTPAGSSDGVLYARVPNALLEALDKWAVALNTDPLVPQWSRNDILRAVLARAIRERADKGEAP